MIDEQSGETASNILGLLLSASEEPGILASRMRQYNIEIDTNPTGDKILQQVMEGNQVLAHVIIPGPQSHVAHIDWDANRQQLVQRSDGGIVFDPGNLLTAFILEKK